VESSEAKDGFGFPEEDSREWEQRGMAEADLLLSSSMPLASCGIVQQEWRVSEDETRGFVSVAGTKSGMDEGEQRQDVVHPYHPQPVPLPESSPVLVGACGEAVQRIVHVPPSASSPAPVSNGVEGLAAQRGARNKTLPAKFLDDEWSSGIQGKTDRPCPKKEGKLPPSYRKRSKKTAQAKAKKTKKLSQLTRTQSPIGKRTRRSKKYTRESISYECLRALFKYPLERAAKELNVCGRTLRRRCKDFGIEKWPYFQVASRKSVLESLAREAAGTSGKDTDPGTLVTLRKSAAERKPSSSKRKSAAKKKVGAEKGAKQALTGNKKKVLRIKQATCRGECIDLMQKVDGQLMQKKQKKNLLEEKKLQEAEARRKVEDDRVQKNIEGILCSRLEPWNKDWKNLYYNRNFHVTKTKMAKRTRNECSVAPEEKVMAKKSRRSEAMVLNDMVKIGKSPVHAWGLFASRTIKEGTKIIEYVGELTRASLADKRENFYERNGMDSTYMFRVGKNLIDATLRGGPARYINHSCDPNCRPRELTKENKIVLFSIKDIQPGQELFYDYKFDFEELGKKTPCHCGAPNCRGWMN